VGKSDILKWKRFLLYHAAKRAAPALPILAAGFRMNAVSRSSTTYFSPLQSQPGI